MVWGAVERFLTGEQWFGVLRRVVFREFCGEWWFGGAVAKLLDWT